MKHVAVCDRINGTHKVAPEPPGFVTLSEAVYLPRADDHQWGVAGEWGLYDLAGAAIEAACNFRGPGKQPISQLLLAKVPGEIETLSDQQFLYVGHIHQHFGHFITTSLSRFWCVQQTALRNSSKLLYHDTLAPVHLFASPYRNPIFRALDLAPDNFVRFQQPVLIRGQITIPEPSFVENCLAHDAFSTCARAIGERLIGSAHTASENPVYLSKSRLSRGFRGFVNESEIEHELSLHGVDVVYPEEHRFDDLLRILARCSRILGIVGSAFHATAFLPGGKRLVGLNQIPGISSNFLVLDKVSSNRATYVFPLETEEKPDVRFGHAWRARNPKQVARELLELAYGPEIVDYAIIATHIRGRGDVASRTGEWCGERGGDRWIEGFIIRSAADTLIQGIEYAAKLNDGSWSRWHGNGEFCGNRRRHAPLRGARFRLKEPASEDYEIYCESIFSDQTTIGPIRGRDLACEASSGAPLVGFKFDVRRR